MSNGVTISTASANLYLTSTSNPLTITSTGSVTSTGSSDAIDAPSGTAWQINNAGTISGVVGTSAAGIYSPASGITIQNTGKISGHVAGLYLTDGGTIVNGATGQISATGSYGVYVSGAAATVTNLGTISGASYAVDLTFSSASNRVVVAPGATFTGLVSGGNGVLELSGSGAAGTLSGTIGGTSGSFENFSQLVVDAGAVWALSGALQITTVQLAGSLEVASDTTSSSQIAFASGGKLIVDNAASFSGPVLSNFVAGDTIDIHNFSAAGAAISYNSATGVATITNSASQTATLHLSASTLGAGQLLAASDGGTGIDVTLGSSTAPAAPTITSPASGSTDTTTAEPTISGTGVAGDTVTLSIDGGASVTTTVLSNGSWNYTPTSPLSNASHTITATQAASGGPSSTAATDTFTVNVAAAPAAPTITNPASGSTDTTTAEPTISGTGVAGDTVTLSIDGGASVTTTVLSNGSWSYTPTSPLSNASHTITATQAASGGPSSTAATDTFTVNVAAAPAAPTITNPASGSTDTTTAEPTISGTGVAGDTVTLSIDGGASVTTTVLSNGSWSYTPTSPLSNASHTITATQAASGGPSSTAATDTFTVNVAAAPAAPTITSPASGSTDTTTAEPTISGTGVAGDTVTLSIDGGASVTTTVLSNGSWSYTPTSPLSNASHTITATQAASGGPSSTAATDTFTVNVAAAPAAPTITNPASGSTDTTTAEPTISGTGVAGDTVTLSIDGGASVTTTVQSNASWSYTPTSPLSNASHTITATQAASGGPSSTAATDTFTVNVAAAPAAPTITSPASGSTDTTTAEPTISGTGVAGDTVTLSIDGGASVTTTVLSNGSWSYTPTSPLSNASHTITATQAASGGPSSAAATDTFTVNVAAAPAAPTITNPASGSTDTTTAEPTISGTGVAGDTVTLSIDGGASVTTTVLSNGSWSYTPTSPLSNASHTITATQAASGGPSSTAATDTFTVNVAAAPAAPTITNPASGSTDTTTAEPTISGTGVAGDTVTLSIDGGASVTTTVLSNGSWSYTPTSPLSNASHTITATQAASGGPSSTAATDTFTVNVAAAPAAPTITSPASGSTDTTTAEPTISGTGVAGDTVTLSIDGGASVTTTVLSNGSWSYTPTSPLSNASHTITATQAATGGPSSTATTDTFTVNVSGGETISTASANLYLTSTSNPLTITSTGSVTSTGSSDAISAPSGTAWQINNAGTISGVVGTSAAGIYSPASGITIQNTGKISGHVAGLYLTDGGTIVNGATGQISATGSYGVYVSGAAATVTNLGTISGASYAVDLTFSSASNRVVVAPGATFTGLVSGGNGVLELSGSGAAGTLSGTIGGTSGSFENFSQLVVDAGAVWALSGALQITTVQLAGSLEVASDTTSSSQIAFASGGKLIVDNAASFSGPVLSNFVAGDTIDIHNFSAAGAAISYNSATGVATITNSASQTATLHLSASTLGAGQLLAASDGGTGIDVTLGSSTAPAAPTITSPASGSTDTTTAEPTISGTGVAGDTVTLSIDGGASVTTTVQSNASWSYTPTSPLSNASHTITATQAASGGPSSTAATDTFTVNVAAAPAAPTITGPANGSTITTTADPTISGTGISGDTVTVSIDGTVAGTTPVASGSWSFTPTAPLSNASHSVSATQAAAGGPSSSSSNVDTFTINVPPAAPTIAVSFSGISDPTNTPPENGLAVGPNYIVMAETSHFLVTDLKGNVNTAATGNGSLSSLFAPLGSTLDNNLLDARVAYDASTGRFVLIALNFQPGGGNFATNIDIAVSKDSNPADGWSLASIATTLSGTTQSDMPYLSVGGGTIYLSSAEYLDAGGYGGTGEWVVNESSVAGSATIVPSASNTASNAYGIMRNVAGANGVTFYVAALSSGTQTILGYQTFSTSGGFSAVQTIAVGDSDVGPGGNGYIAQQQGTSLTLGVGDGDARIQSLAYANGYLWGVSEVKPSGATAPQILWFKINVSNPAAPVLVLQGAISGAAIGTSVAVFNPSIAVDQNGDVLINFSASGPNMYPSDYFTVLAANASAFSAPTLYQASNTYFNSGSLNDQRWGTYSTAVADPNNANGFWLSNEYVSTAVTGPGGSPSWWDTVTAQVLVGGSVNIAPAGVTGEAVNLGLSNPTVADLADTIKVSVTGAPLGWFISGGTQNPDGSWTIETADPSAATITTATNFVGAAVLGITETWTNADGTVGMATAADNVEAYAAASPIFAWSGNDNLTGSSGHDTFVFSQPIGNDVVHSFDVSSDTIDLIGYSGFTTFVDVQAHTADDTNGNAVITLANGQTITLDGVHTADLTSTNFEFDVTPTTKNPGTMTIGDGAMLPLSGVIDNTGTIALNSAGSETDLELIQHGITLQGGGQVNLSDNAENIIFSTSSDVTLTNLDNTIQGAGQLGQGQLNLVNEATINASGTNALVIDTGSNPIVNSGTLEATGSGGLVVNSAIQNSGNIWADGGNVTVNGAVTGNGTATISGSSTLEFSAASDDNTSFAAGATGTLKLDQAEKFSGSVSGFGAGDKLDLADIAFGANLTLGYSANAAGTGGMLSVSDGTHSASIALFGQFAAAGFHVGSDAGSGTMATYTPPDQRTASLITLPKS